MKEFEEYKSIHNFMYPEEPLKGWVTKDNYFNYYIDDYENLMEVVEKIESIDSPTTGGYRYNVVIEQCFVEIIENHTSEVIVEEDANTKKEAIYYAILEFINFIS